ncbi:GSCFA domain-containing protein [Flavobacterium sp. SUN052]|uniref:GSCFA domain-containing protein n=1 Tax=Flavobacterium sp. SUN052 TaxID=3002441 RepID=UPI00237DD914|nr:GSCFA domain-containing protein [Flavobacterium sp. SUN052]MEC4004726.1 GSCFA domain-containing protein [Flavobacterium sp. SUN052]
MNFTTKVPIEKMHNPIKYDSKIVSLGSCFAENIGAKFEYFKFKNIINPFGIIFNPVSIESLISRAIENKLFTEKDIFFHNEQWHCFEVHSDLSNSNKEEFLQNLNEILSNFKIQITDTTHLIITYGTSWVYRNIASNEIVANCHKVPQNQFEKEILSIETIQKSIQNSIDLIHKINPNCNFIFTISPVRHIKDGFVENQRSKAHLITALQSSIFHFPSSNYFPSYEIMMDELRDYRFYAEDMLHPNQTAIDYIWIQFLENYINESEFETMNEVCSIQKSLLHRAFNPNSENHQKFLANLDAKISKLQQKAPFLKFS